MNSFNLDENLFPFPFIDEKATMNEKTPLEQYIQL